MPRSILDMTRVPLSEIYEIINLIFCKYHHKKYIHPDPIEFLYNYDSIRDREIVGLISSSLAYGRVNQIIKSTSFILKKMSPSPYKFVRNNSFIGMCKIFDGFRHRFADGNHIAALLFGVKKILNDFGSLNNCFRIGFINGSRNTINGLTYFVNKLSQSKFDFGHLIAHPSKKSACKRLNLFLRWMLRHDNIDPGGWFGIPTSELIIPLDTHMHKTGLLFGFSKRRYTSMMTALEITNGFKMFAPKDPVKYDFSLTRLGILNGSKLKDFLNLE